MFWLFKDKADCLSEISTEDLKKEIENREDFDIVVLTLDSLAGGNHTLSISITKEDLEEHGLKTRSEVESFFRLFLRSGAYYTVTYKFGRRALRDGVQE